MKRVKGLAIAASLAFAVMAAPEFGSVSTFETISGTTYPSLTAADWDGDGDQDLLVGVYVSGKSDETAGEIRYLENVGSNTNPQYEQRGAILNGSSTLTVGGSS